MRLFVCSFLQAANQEFYDRRVADLVGVTAGRVRPVPRNSAHVTYAFLGETDAAVLDDIRGGVGSATTREDTIASIQIVSSTLGPEAPAYTVVADVPLGSR